MANRVVHRKPHKFKKRKAVVRTQAETEKQQGEIQEGIVTAQTPVVATGFPKPYEPASQATFQEAKVQSETQPVGAQPIIASSNISTVSAEKPVQNVAPPLPETEPAHKKSKLWVILAFVVILGIVGGGLYYFREEFILKTAEEEEKVQTPAPSPSEVSPSPELEENAATPSADVEVDPAQYSIKVLNGSGIAGEAAKVRDILEEASFIVEDIGNADTSSYKKTVIRAKKDVSKDFLDLLREELGKMYLLDENEDLEESEDADVVVIVGEEEV